MNESESANEATDSTDVISPPELYPLVDQPCFIEHQHPSRLLVTTTDFATGAISIIDIANKHVRKDIALSSTDAVPFYFQDRAYILHRYMNDYIDVLESNNSWQLAGQFAIRSQGFASTNPHSMVLGPQGIAYLVLYEAPQIQLYDFTKSAKDAYFSKIDLAASADHDGIPEASLSFTCGNMLFVSIQRLQRQKPDWPPVDHDFLLLIDMQTNQLQQLHSDTNRLQGLELLGTWARQIRADPWDLSQQTALVLTTGIEHIDLRTGEVSWLVSEQVFIEHGINNYRLPQSFDLSADGNQIYVAAYRQDFSAVDIFHIDRRHPNSLRLLISGLHSVHQTLEVLGDELWFGNTPPGQSGFWVYDLRSDPPQKKLETPLSVGLPPYSIIAIP